MPPPMSVSPTPNPYRGQKDTRPCSNCGVQITRYLNTENVGRPWVCSKRCNMLVRNRPTRPEAWKPLRKPRRGDTVPCAICGTPFYRQPAYVSLERKFCSRVCLGRSQRRTPVVKACSQCGAAMTLKPSRGQQQYCSKRCESEGRIKRPTGRYHNGRPVLVEPNGYLTLWEPTSPMARAGGRVPEHRWVMAQVLGRPLTSDEHVDHINQDRADNRPENLQVLSPSDHSRKTNGDRERAMQALRDQIAAFEAKYGPLDME
jgi:endogenous inhibitor of DNA gyrase (YacG/DUF329 family)